MSMLTRDQIRAIFMAHGFTVKEGQTDLKPYVYEAAESLLRAALEAREEPVAPDAVWLIQYDDYDCKPEIIVGEAAARARFSRVSIGWNAHLFVKVESNSRDTPYRDANIRLASSPVAATQGDAKDAARLIAAGASLSNIAFNLSQHAGDPLNERHVAAMKECQLEWDAALREFRAAMKDQQP
jgi:hypothetical protein